MKVPMNRDFRSLLIAGLIGGAVALGASKLIDRTPSVIRFASGNTATSRLASLAESGVDFTSVAEIANPAVVHIKATSSGRTMGMGGSGDPFEDFFGGRGMRMMPQQSSGSGVIIASNGHIVTNNHVVKDAQELEVTLYDNRTYKAEVIGVDPTTDLAVIKINEKDLPTLVIGNSDNVRVGEWVMAVGNPFNLTSTVTAGIVSAKGRNINILRENAAIESFIQTDAAVNPGNSGGALVNMNGELIGINTAIASQTGSYAGYSFAVPSNIVGKVVEDMIRYGKVQRAFLGITIRNLDNDLVEDLNLDFNEGVYVDSVVAGGSAAGAGIKRKDVIVKIDDREVKTVPELQEIIGRHRPGDDVNVVVVRNGEEKAIQVKLKTLEGKTEVAAADPEEMSLKSLGADFETIPGSLAKKLGVEGGVKIKRLYPGKLRTQTDVREGFIITKANRKPVNSVSDLSEALKDSGDGALIEGVYEDQKGKFFYGFGM